MPHWPTVRLVGVESRRLLGIIQNLSNSKIICFARGGISKRVIRMGDKVVVRVHHLSFVGGNMCGKTRDSCIGDFIMRWACASILSGMIYEHGYYVSNLLSSQKTQSRFIHFWPLAVCHPRLVKMFLSVGTSANGLTEIVFLSGARFYSTAM